MGLRKKRTPGAPKAAPLVFPRQPGLFDPAITLMHGGCEHLLHAHRDTFQVIFADSPYNTDKSESIAMTYSTSEAMIAKNWTDFHATWDALWATEEEYYEFTVGWLEQVRHALTSDGTVFACGSHHGDWALNLALKKLGFYIIHEIAWCIPNAMPHLAQKRMASSNQTIFWARKGKKSKYVYDYKAAKSYNDGKNLRDYWLIPNATHIRDSKHPSKKPPALMQRAFDIATTEGAQVCDPFAGSGRSILGALSVPKVKGVTLFELNGEYVQEIAHNYNLVQVDQGKYTNG